MSFQIKLKKNEAGAAEVESFTGELPDHLTIGGHVENGAVVDISVSTHGLFATANKR